MREVFGGILMAVGILIAGASGLCSAVVLFTPGEYSGLEMWPAVLTVGGIPFAIGLAMAFGGRALRRRSSQGDADTPS
jgi:hypothetical protein